MAGSIAYLEHPRRTVLSVCETPQKDAGLIGRLLPAVPFENVACFGERPTPKS